MRYTQPKILATHSAAASIQQVHNSGIKPPGEKTDQTHNSCTPSGYDADE